MNTPSKNKRGLSLIELVIVIGIIGILSSIILANLVASRNQREVQAGAQQLAGHIREAQNYALTGKAASIDENNCSYGVQSISPTQYQIVRVSRGASGCGLPTSIGGTLDLPRGVTMTGLSSPILFALPRAETGLSSTVDITLTKSGASAHVCVSKSGAITEQTSACS